MSLFALRLFAFWTRIWRNATTALSFLSQDSDPVKLYTDVKEIPVALNYGKNYRPDPGKRSRLDITIHPAVTQWKINNDSYGKRANDCDDHAMYWCAALYKSKLAKKVWFVQVNWEDSGHAICVYETADKRFFWADYNDPVEIVGKWGWVTPVAQKYNQTKTKFAMMHNVKFKEESLGKKFDTPKLKTSDIKNKF